jgi:hypothetical protein
VLSNEHSYIDGTATAPSTGDPSLPSQADLAALASRSDMTVVKAKTDQLNFGVNIVNANQSLDVRWLRTTKSCSWSLLLG